MRLIGLILSMAALLPCSARSVADFFVSAPAEAVPLLTDGARADMLAYYRSGLSTATNNILEGKSRISSLDSLSMNVSLSGASELQMAVLPNRGDTVIAIIETVASPVKDSSLRLYRAADWQPLPDVSLPSMDDFIPRSHKKELAAVELPTIFFIGIEYDPAQGLFLIRNNSFDNYPSGSRPTAADLMDPVQAYRYDGRKLVRVKDFMMKFPQ